MSQQTAEAPAQEILTLEIQQNGTTATVLCRGRLVSGAAASFYAQVAQLPPETRHIILDLGNVTYMDSLGLGTLVRLYVHTKSTGSTLQLIHLTKRIHELLGLTGLLSVFSVIGEHGMKF